MPAPPRRGSASAASKPTKPRESPVAPRRRTASPPPEPRANTARARPTALPAGPARSTPESYHASSAAPSTLAPKPKQRASRPAASIAEHRQIQPRQTTIEDHVGVRDRCTKHQFRHDWLLSPVPDVNPDVVGRCAEPGDAKVTVLVGDRTRVLLLEPVCQPERFAAQPEDPSHPEPEVQVDPRLRARQAIHQHPPRQLEPALQTQNLRPLEVCPSEMHRCRAVTMSARHQGHSRTHQLVQVMDLAQPTRSLPALRHSPRPQALFLQAQVLRNRETGRQDVGRRKANAEIAPQLRDRELTRELDGEEAVRAGVRELAPPSRLWGFTLPGQQCNDCALHRAAIRIQDSPPHLDRVIADPRNRDLLDEPPFNLHRRGYFPERCLQSLHHNTIPNPLFGCRPNRHLTAPRKNSPATTTTQRQP